MQENEGKYIFGVVKVGEKGQNAIDQTMEGLTK